MKNIFLLVLSIVMLSFQGCMEDYLDLYPKDKITSANFPTQKSDLDLLLNGIYSQLRDKEVYNQGLFGFGITDGATPNAFNWGTGEVINKLGAGRLASSDEGIVTFRWKRCYEIISRSNYLLSSLDLLELTNEDRAIYEGEAHFLRGLAYSVLAETYGGVPIILKELSTQEAREVKRASLEETWQQAIDDYDIAIANLNVEAPVKGRATKGAALGMKMRAYLYQGKFKEVLPIVDQIDALKKYGLFHSYEGLFDPENEYNEEVIFDIQYIQGENSQGSYIDQYCGTGTGSWTRGSRYVPTDDLVAAYETIDGSPVDPENPYENRDPRLAFTCVLPGSYFLGYRFPNYLYPGGAFNHPGNQLKHLSTRKYRIKDESKLPPSGQSYINDIVLRYADVLLSKAEALVETDGSIADAIAILNRIRTERDDVKISLLPTSMSREEAREKVRHERRIELALEGRYWSDVKRWKIGKDLYPMPIYDHTGSLIDTKFPNGYLEYYDLLPIPDSERSLNENLEQNPGW
ncbi:MAG: RagB/SusD family nutrient uptake outer membrane protein [Parabacteroides sp.]